MNRNILVVGGTSYFGKHLVNILIEAGEKVWVATRGNNSINPNASFIYFDRFKDKPLDTKIIFDIVYDQSCYSSSSLRNLTHILSSCGMYILTSSQAVYSNGWSIIEESINYNKVDEYINKINSYGFEKLKAEAYIARYTDRYVCPRFPTIIGKNDPRMRLQNLITQVKTGYISLPETNPFFQYLYEQDAAHSLYKLSLTTHQGPINIANPNPISVKSLCELIANKLNQRLHIEWSRDFKFEPFDLIKSETKTLNTVKQGVINLNYKNINEIIEELNHLLN